MSYISERQFAADIANKVWDKLKDSGQFVRESADRYGHALWTEAGSYVKWNAVEKEVREAIEDGAESVLGVPIDWDAFYTPRRNPHLSHRSRSFQPRDIRPSRFNPTKHRPMWDVASTTLGKRQPVGSRVRKGDLTGTITGRKNAFDVVTWDDGTVTSEAPRNLRENPTRRVQASSAARAIYFNAQRHPGAGPPTDIRRVGDGLFDVVTPNPRRPNPRGKRYVSSWRPGDTATLRYRVAGLAIAIGQPVSVLQVVEDRLLIKSGDASGWVYEDALVR